MKAIGILAAASLALSPVTASANSDVDNTESRPISGPLAGRVLKKSDIPVGAVIAGILVLVGGVVVGVLAAGGGGGGGSGSSTNSTNSTN